MDALNRHRKCLAHSTQHILTNIFQCAQREGRAVRRPKTKHKPTAQSIPLGSTLQIQWDLGLQTPLVALWQWTSALEVTTMAVSKLSLTIGRVEC